MAVSERGIQMELFHYHWWTDKTEEMEKFYREQGFETKLRVGRYQGDMQPFNPPLTWDDFRDKQVAFRIIEMVNGQTNVTFGHGTKDRFDHIGILVSETEYKRILENAEALNWRVSEGERRTFISTPWRFRIELQLRMEVVSDQNHTQIKAMEMDLPFQENPESIAHLLGLTIGQRDETKVEVGNKDWKLVFSNKNDTRLSSVYFTKSNIHATDPVGTKLMGKG